MKVTKWIYEFETEKFPYIQICHVATAVLRDRHKEIPFYWEDSRTKEGEGKKGTVVKVITSVYPQWDWKKTKTDVRYEAEDGDDKSKEKQLLREKMESLAAVLDEWAICQCGGGARKGGKEEGRKREREKLKLVISLSGREGLLAVYLLHTDTHTDTPWSFSHPLSFWRQTQHTDGRK